MFFNKFLYSLSLLHLRDSVGIHLARLAVLCLGGMDTPLAHGLVATDMSGGETTLQNDAY
jgi:hypothetical protein